MPGYRVVIVGHLDIWKKPPNGSLPDEILQAYNVDVDTEAGLSNFIDARMADIVGSGAMKVYRDPDMREIGKLQPWITVPLHMITHVSYRLKLLTGDLPVYSKAEGKSVLPDGSDPKVN